MNNPPDWAFYSPATGRDNSTFTFISPQRILTALVLLSVGYYTTNALDLWPSTVKRFVFEWFIYLVPSRIIYEIEHLMHRYGRLSYDAPMFKKEDFGNQHAKSESVQRMFEGAGGPVKQVIRRARTLSGLNSVWRPIDGSKPPGLGNWDNSCYQNSVLQGFASLPAFREFIEMKTADMQRSGQSAPTSETLDEFLEQLSDLSGTSSYLWTPAVLKSMDSWSQQDAQEYFSTILDEVDKEVTKHEKSRQSKPGLENLRKRKYDDYQENKLGKGRGGAESGETVRHGEEKQGVDIALPTSSTQEEQAERPPPQKTPAIRNPLDGMFAQTLECQMCGFSEGFTFSQFSCLTVNLGEGGSVWVEQLLDEFTDLEEVEGVECLNCTKIAEKKSCADAATLESHESDLPLATTKPRRKPLLRTKVKQVTIGRLPRDLVIHVNRSIFDQYGNQRKNTAMVGFPFRLDFLSRWCVEIESSGPVQKSYELKCAVTHFGRHENGHYIAYGKRDKDWYRFNDEEVTRVELDDVLAAGNVFMLFYEAVEEPIAEPESPTPEVESAVPEQVMEAAVESQDDTKTKDGDDEFSGLVNYPSPSPSSSDLSETQPNTPPTAPVAAVPVPAMRTATPAHPDPQTSDINSSSIVQAL